jgi:hypothetical protein
MAHQAGEVGLGFSVHTGWAILVGVARTPQGSIDVLLRRRIELVADPKTRFVYHRASELPLAEAGPVVSASVRAAFAATEAALKVAISDLVVGERRIVAGSLIVGASAVDAPLERILGSHSLIHAAEGALYRDALRAAHAALAVPLVEVRRNELQRRAAAALAISTGELDQRLAEIGRAAGKPWAKDHKQACLGAAIALAFDHE